MSALSCFVCAGGALCRVRVRDGAESCCGEKDGKGDARTGIHGVEDLGLERSLALEAAGCMLLRVVVVCKFRVSWENKTLK